MILTKDRGSYAKRTTEPVSTDLDRRIAIGWFGSKWGGDLILTTSSGSDGSRGFGCGAAARFRGGGSPAQTESGVPGLDSGRGWVKEHRRKTCNPSVPSGREISARLGTRGGAGCVRRSIDGARCPACQSSLRPNWSGANGGVGFWGAHRGGLVDGFAAQGTGGEVWAAKSTRSPGRSRCGRRGRRRKVRGGSWR